MGACTTDGVRATADQFLLRMQQAHRAGAGVQRGRDLMRSAGVDPETARQALERLVAKGLVEKAAGEPGAWMLTAEGLPPPVEERPAPAPAAEYWDGTGPRWWPTVVPGRPRYYPVPGRAPEKVLLAFDRFPNGARPADISRAVGENLSHRLAELATYGVLVKDGHGFYRLATTPPATVASGATVEAEPVSEPAGEAGGDAGEATGGADSSPALGWQRPQVPAVEPATVAEQALVSELAELRATVKAVRAHLGAGVGEDLEGAVLRVLAARDVAEAERDDARREVEDRRSKALAREAARILAGPDDLDTARRERDDAREGCRRLAADLEAQTRRADGLERIASRRPVVPGPRLPAPGPSILGPEIAKAAREVACDGCAAAIGEIADHLGIEETNPAAVAGVVKALVDDLDDLGEQVAGPGAYDAAEVIEVLRKEVGKVEALQADLAAERAVGVALLDHVRTLAGDLAVALAEQDARTARAISRAMREGGDL